MLTINLLTARRFTQASRACGPGGASAAANRLCTQGSTLHLDPLQIIARSQDILLHSRVLDYTPGMWEQIAYGEDRQFFDWGGWLAARPLDELPYRRVVHVPRARRQRGGVVIRTGKIGSI